VYKYIYMMSDHSSTEKITFTAPVRRIKTLQSLAQWSKSLAYHDLLAFIITVNESIKCTKLSDECNPSPCIVQLTALLDTLQSWTDTYPPCEQPQRFGNKAYRDWSKCLDEKADELITNLLPEECKEAVIELRVYLLDSFGNSTRIDYGTGHEAYFLFFLCSLYKLKILTPSDHLAIVNIVLKKYLEVMRHLQKTYRMEPAGSHGVWGLDDFQFIPFIWGSAQLIDHKTIKPSDIPESEAASRYADEYIFFGCLKYISEVKTGPFGEHSNTLWGISSVAHWKKVNEGLLKMFKVEVLSKFPIVQHFAFGSIISFEPK